MYRMSRAGAAAILVGAWSGVAATMAMAVAGCSDAIACTAIGCGPPVSVTFVEPAPGAPKRLEACLNDECLELHWPPQPLDTCSSSDPNKEGSRLDLCSRSTHAEVVWQGSHVALRDGDAFHLTVFDEDGEVLLEDTRALEYDESRPNGPDCDPDPCRTTQYAL